MHILKMESIIMAISIIAILASLMYSHDLKKDLAGDTNRMSWLSTFLIPFFTVAAGIVFPWMWYAARYREEYIESPEHTALLRAGLIGYGATVLLLSVIKIVLTYRSRYKRKR